MIALTLVPSEPAAAQALIAKWAAEEDYTHMAARRQPAARHNSLVARAAVRALLAERTGISGWSINSDSKGKPLAQITNGLRRAHISLSHTKGLIACAISCDEPFGIDLEYYRGRDFAAFAAYAFGPKERQEVACGGISSFYRIWTVREAMSKVGGEGVLAALGKDVGAGDIPESGCWQDGSWQLFHSSPKPNYSLAIASKGNDVWSEDSFTWVDVVGSI